MERHLLYLRIAAENATIVGDVSFGESCSVWFNAVIRET
jgi:carbonic anhydrase/acetyltransferase-like protein (isoleucine patch superfamily)